MPDGGNPFFVIPEAKEPLLLAALWRKKAAAANTFHRTVTLPAARVTTPVQQRNRLQPKSILQSILAEVSGLPDSILISFCAATFPSLPFGCGME